MNEFFENTHHLKSLISNSSCINISIPSTKKVEYNSPNKYRQKFKGKEENRERWENRVQSYKEMDLSNMYNEIVLIDWDYVKTLKKSSRCPYCNLGHRKSKDHFIPTYYRKGIYYQHKAELSKEKMIIITCCKTCNGNKGNLLPSEWLKEINLKIETFTDTKRNYLSDRYYLNVKETLMNILRMP